jgi:hypothetical protein
MSDAARPFGSDGAPGSGNRLPSSERGEVHTARVELDDSAVAALYANICRVASTPEEVIIDLALDPSPLQEGSRTVRVAQRVIVNHYTAKRLINLLSSVIERHEKSFGPLETDVRKRLRRA